MHHTLSDTHLQPAWNWRQVIVNVGVKVRQVEPISPAPITPLKRRPAGCVFHRSMAQRNRRTGSPGSILSSLLTETKKKIADLEGWILGIS